MIVLVIAFLCILQQILSICIPGTQTGTCFSCNSNSYSQTLIDNFGGSVAESNCQPKLASLNTNLYVQSTACASGSACDGSSSSPFDSLIKCLISVHKTASQYLTSKIIIYLLTGNHFLLANDLPLSASINPFLRRVSIDLTIQPLYCSISNIPGCFTNSSDVANVFLKTNKFMIFINNILTLRNLVISSIDSVLESKGDACLSLKSSCCTQADLNNSASVCNIQGLSVSLIPLTNSLIPSFFVIEGIFESSDTNTPTLLCVGVQFNFFNAFNPQNSFNSFIAISNTNPFINLTNTVIQFSYFPFGIVSSYDFTLDAFYLNLDSTQKAQFITKYSALIQNVVCSNLIMANYNFYKIVSNLVSGYFRFKNKASTISITQSSFQNFTHVSQSGTFFDILSQTLSISNSNFSTFSSFTFFNCKQTNIFLTFSIISNFINALDNFSTQNLCVLNLTSSSITNLDYTNNAFDLQTNSAIFSNNSLWNLVKAGTIFNLQINNILNFTFSNITFCTFSQYSVSQKSSHYYVFSNMFNSGNGQVFYLSNNDSILFQNFKMENITATSVIEGKFGENIIYTHSVFKNIMSEYFESFSFLPYFTIQQNTTYINLTANNFFSVSDDFLSGPTVYYKGTDMLITNSTDLFFYIFCIWSRNFELNNTIIANTTSLGTRSFIQTLGKSTTTFIIRNLTFINPKVNTVDGYQVQLKSLLVARNAKSASIENISISIPASINFDENAINFQTTDLVTLKNITVKREAFSTLNFFYGISFLDIPNIVVDTVYIANLSCSNKSLGVDNTLGIISVIGFPSFEFNSNTRTLNLSNIYIDTVFCQYASGIGVLNINTVNIKNVTIKNCKSQNFASFFFFQSISNLILTNSSLYNGSNSANGGIYIKTVLNSTFSMISADLLIGGVGGLLWISNSNLNISTVNATNIICDSGALIYQSNNGNIQITNTKLSNSAANTNGGGIVVVNSNLIASSLIFSNINCQQGGAFFIYSGLIIDIGFVTCSNCSASQKGNFILVMESFSLTLHDSGSYFSSSLSQGTIFIYSQVIHTYSLYNINCINLTHSDGSCFYLYTNSIVNIGYANIINCTGGAIFIYSNIENSLSFSNFIIQNHNAYIAPLLVNASKYLIQSNGIIINMKNIVVSKSFFDNAFNIYLGKLVISEIDCSNVTQDANNYLFNLISTESFISNYSFLGPQLIENKHLKSVDSFVTFSNSSFSKIYSQSSTGFLLQDSEIFVLNSKLLNSSGFGGLINLIDSNISVQNSSFTNLIPQITQSMNFIYSKVESISAINNLQILNSSFLSTNIGAMIKIDTCSNATIDNSNFTSGNYSNFSMVSGLNILNTNSSSIANSMFVNLNNDFGGGFYLENSRFPTLSVTISNSSFTNCSAKSGGSIYIQGNSSFTMSNSKVENSQAILNSGIGGIGGGLLYNCYYISENCQTLLFNSTFLSNQASLYGSNFFGRSSLQMIQVYLFQSLANNHDEINFPIDVIFLSEINSLDKSKNISLINIGIKNMLSTKNLISFSNQSSGNGFSFSFVLVDSNFHILSYDNISTASIDAQLVNSSNNTLKLQNSASLSVNGIFFFSNLIITTYPPADLSLTFQFSINILNPKTNALEIISITKYASLKIRTCFRGEILATDSSCLKCGEGYYSLKDPMNGEIYQECILCPLNAYCPGGDVIIPNSGFWRSNNNSILIQECLNPSACLTIQSSNGYPLYSTCAVGYYGNFCYECQAGFARLNTNGQCVRCNKDLFNYFKFIAFLIGISIFILFQVKYYMMLNDNDSPIIGVLFKIFVNHFQQLSLITLINLGWTSQIKNLFNFLSYFSFLNDDILSIDCFFTDTGYHVVFFKIIFANIMPIITTTSVIIISLAITNFLKKSRNGGKKRFIKESKVTLAVTIYILYPAILKNCFELLNCKKIDELTNTSVLSLSPSLVCFEKTHLLWTVFVSIPGILLWGIFSVLFFYFLLSKYKKSLIRILDKNNEENLLNVKKTLREDHDEFDIQTITQRTIIENKEYATDRKSDKNESHTIKLNLSQSGNDGVEISQENDSRQVKESNSNSGQIIPKNKIETYKDKDEVKNGGNKSKIIRYIMFLYRGYKGKYYYWEVLIFSKKFILIMLTSFNNIIGDYTKSSILIIFFVVFLIATKNSLPYANPVLNRVELLSYYTLFLTTNIGILLFSSETQNIAFILMIIVGIMQGTFCLVGLYYFIHFLKVTKKLKAYLKRIKSMKSSSIREVKLQKKQTGNNIAKNNYTSGLINKQKTFEERKN